MTEQLTFDVPMSQSLGHCDLAACRICTGCAHGEHRACRGVVRCPDDGVLRVCRYAPASVVAS